MNKFVVLVTILTFILLAPSCRNGNKAGNIVVTKRIQYDVPIRNTDTDMDWWVQNIEGSNREKLVKDILSKVTGGEVKAYDFLSYKPFLLLNFKLIVFKVLD